ncbi:hypothetical protein [Mesoplasma chauliocola]|uniref:hypothetical protein n=1 Tax=Mesoplasma chauliocola TaxID=216427 RepID=UPI0012EC26F2|nr:hypothetical protein [Mesoplasma chauliocola]
MFNFWNTWYGWTDPKGKESEYSSWVYSYKLNGYNYKQNTLQKTDESHSSNERARVI